MGELADGLRGLAWSHDCAAGIDAAEAEFLAYVADRIDDQQRCKWLAASSAFLVVGGGAGPSSYTLSVSRGPEECRWSCVNRCAKPRARSQALASVDHGGITLEIVGG